ncbi:MAG: four-carbon acid sugar kinase family protein [Hyphomicrobiales bacterium]
MSQPNAPLLAWYGDDFTGSATVMEEFAFAGVESVLFLDIPDAEQLARFASARTTGLAGTSRAHSPDWMEQNLPAPFAFLQRLNASLNLYKICSTLDSSPEIGSIGKALAIARKQFGQGVIPLFPASPKMGRYQCFGTLFARADQTVYRLDRHPVVSHHPVTPMDEADVARHIARQTDEPIGLITLTDLPRAQEVFATLAKTGVGMVSIDAVGSADLIACGQLFASLPHGSLLAGSQGVAEALVEYWRTIGENVGGSAQLQTPGRANKMVGLSGSLSPTTHSQIDQALADGFVGVPLDTERCLGTKKQAAVRQSVEATLAILSEGKSPLVYSARGRDDPAVAKHQNAAERLGLTSEVANQKIGEALGEVLSQLVTTGAVTRAAIAGGDSSGYALKRLNMLALTALMPTAPGAALYRAHPMSKEGATLEVALKGGQMGSRTYFAEIRDGNQRA